MITFKNGKPQIPRNMRFQFRVDQEAWEKLVPVLNLYNVKWPNGNPCSNGYRPGAESRQHTWIQMGVRRPMTLTSDEAVPYQPRSIPAIGVDTLMIAEFV